MVETKSIDSRAEICESAEPLCPKSDAEAAHDQTSV